MKKNLTKACTLFPFLCLTLSFTSCSDASSKTSINTSEETSSIEVSSASISDKLSLNNVELEKYSIVYADKNTINKNIAETLSASIKENCNLTLPVISDTTADSGNEIFVGLTTRLTDKTSSKDKFSISKEGDSALLISDTTSGLIASSKKLSSDLKLGSVDYSTSYTSTYEDLSIKVMSYNIRMTSEDRWDRLYSVISRNNPDLLGIQEVSTYWQPKFKNELYGYTCVGEGRGDSTGEAGYILYKTDKFELEETGTRWYSATPTKASKLADSTYNRIYTYASLKRKSDNKEFLYINTHLDLNQSARMESIKMLKDFIEDQYPDTPTYITGDFNTGYNWSYKNWEWKELEVSEYDADDYLAENDYSNSRLAATVTDDHFTYPTTLYPADASEEETIIDYCFIKQDIFVDSYKVDADLPDDPNTISGCGSDASDHYPIIASTVLY